MSAAPEVSIVIPTFDRPERLARCLDGLATLRTEARLEVIVADDGGSMPLGRVLESVEHQLDLRLERQRNAGPGAARNLGAERARGRLLAFIDDDCVPEPTWITSLLLCHSHDHSALVGGRTINALSANTFAQASQDLVSYLYDYYGRTHGTPAFFTSNNMLVERGAFLEAGGFDTSFQLAAGEDRELCDRWRHRGGSLRYAPDAVIRHYHDLDLPRFSRQHFNYGRGAYRYHLVRRERGYRHTIEPFSFYARLIGWPLHDGGGRKLRRAALMLLSQAANAAGYFYERKAGAAPRQHPPAQQGGDSVQ